MASNIKKSILNRILFSFVCVVAFAGLIVWYIINIQVVNGSKWRALSDSLTLKYKVIQAVRGNIYTYDGILLATSVPRYELRLDMTVLADDSFRKYMPLLAQNMASKFADKSAAEYLLSFRAARRDGNRYYLLRKKLNFLDIKEIKTWPLLNKSRFKSGLIVEEDNYRVLPFKNLLLRTIGRASNGKNQKPVGIEGAFDQLLAGTTGRRLVQKISGGYRPVNDNNELEPVDGKDVYTTIDVHLQDIVNNALLNAVTKHQAHHGCAILMDVKTGEIRAIANLTDKGNGDYQETYNYAIGESFEPGSTYKLVSALALLEKEKIDINDTVLINNGSFTINGKTMMDAEISPFKNNSFAYAFEHSSNVGISTAVMNGFGEHPEEFINYLRTLKIDKPLGVDLPGEEKPYLKSPSSRYWSKNTLPWMSIGYEVRITPLQLLSVYNAVANNGVLVKPYIIKAIGNKGDIEKSYKTAVLNEEIASSTTLKKIKFLLKAVVDSGTARTIHDSKTSISGKTGTAKISDGKGYFTNAYFSSFAGYFPSENPKYSIIVVINRPTTGGYFGGVVAAPVVKEIAEKIMGNSTINAVELSDTLKGKPLEPLGLAGNQGKLLSFLEKFTDADYNDEGKKTDWVSIHKNPDNEYDLVVENQPKNTIPNLIGMGLRDAVFCAENKKLNITYQGKGKVYWQSIPAGTPMQKGNTILVKLRIQ
jgi:cell division protein FtsI (penicillin-binding protein 3)